MQVRSLSKMEKPAPIPMRSKVSISAEAFGRFNPQIPIFIPVVKHKSQELKEKIRARLCTSFMFNSLDEAEMGIVIDAMGEHHIKAGQRVITQGEHGNELYVVEEGQLDCEKVFVSPPLP